MAGSLRRIERRGAHRWKHELAETAGRDATSWAEVKMAAKATPPSTSKWVESGVSGAGGSVQRGSSIEDGDGGQALIDAG